ncbi:hypothetical protein [Brevibacillus centrosporus]
MSQKCVGCKGNGFVGGLSDGDEWIPEEICYLCGGSGAEFTTIAGGN